MYLLWIEYEKQESLESKIIKDLHKLDIIIQAQEYELDKINNKNIDLSEFFKETEIAKSLDKELIKQRQNRLNNNNNSHLQSTI